MLTDNETKKAAECKEIVKEKIKAIYPHIAVGDNIDKPCYSIHWYDIEEKTMYCGFSSYNLEFVRKWLQEEFEIVENDIDDLINRLQADVKHLDDESDALRADIYFLEEELKTAEAENERLKESCSHIDICCKNCKYLIRYKGSAPLVAQCTKRHKDFLPFDVGDSIETYYCRGFAPFKFNTTNEAEIKAEAYKEVEEKLSETTWYRINQEGELVVGANSETDIPLYKAEDVYNLLKELAGE